MKAKFFIIKIIIGIDIIIITIPAISLIKNKTLNITIKNNLNIKISKIFIIMKFYK